MRTGRIICGLVIFVQFIPMSLDVIAVLLVSLVVGRHSFLLHFHWWRAGLVATAVVVIVVVVTIPMETVWNSARVPVLLGYR